jgi:mannosyltransferase
LTTFALQKFLSGYQSLTEEKKTNFLLFLILTFSLAMRLWKIDFQSLWLDELHTMNESDPDIRWKDMLFYLKCCDQHPPLYFVLSRISFELFGHTALSARLIAVVAGTTSVWAMFLLGKEILNKNLGLIAAALTAVNYYNLYYSQEARGYILAFLFAALSFLFFIRLLKNKTIKNSILYAVFTLLLLFSHYYSLFVLASQIVLIILFFFLTETTKKKAFLLYFLLSGLIIAIGYFPWLPYLQAMANIRSFWIQSIADTPLSDFFFEYFGRASLLKHLLIILLLGYLLKVFYSGKKLGSDPVSNPLWFSFIIFSGWILVTCLIPYIRSLLVVPMLLPRYTIVVLPAILVILAYGIELINFKRVKTIILTIYIIFSLISIVISRKYYTAVSKSQFREMTHFVVANNSENYPIINEVVSWQHQYYFKAFNFKPNMLDGPKSIVVDSILAGKSSKYKVNGFWIVGAHGDKPFAREQKKPLDTAFVMALEKKFFDAWAQLYIRKKQLTNN